MDVSIDTDRVLIMGKQLIVVILVGSLIGAAAPAIGLAEETADVLNAPKVSIDSESPWFKKAWGAVTNKGNEVKAALGTAIKSKTDPDLKIQALEAERDFLLIKIQSLKAERVETRVSNMVSLDEAQTCVTLLGSFVQSAVVSSDPVTHFRVITDAATEGGSNDG